VNTDIRPALPGELCTCGRQARVVYVFPDRSDRREIGDCDIRDGGSVSGPCPFCGAAEKHSPCLDYRLRPDGVDR
jgi:hypothetical protein